MSRFHRSLLVVPALALATACGRVREMVTDMVHVQRCVADRAGTNSVNMSFGNKRFTLGLANSPLDTLPAEARAAAARRVAQCVRENYHRATTLDEVAITFTKRSKVGPANVSTSTTPLVFAMKDLGTSAPAATDSTAGQAKAPN